MTVDVVGGALTDSAAVDVGQVVVVCVAVLFASFIQTLAGFGFGLLAMPLMTMAISPQRAVVVSSLIAVGITTWQAWAMRSDMDRALARRLIVPAYVGMPLGLLALSTLGDDVLRIALGVAVLLAVVALASGVALPAGRVTVIGAGFLSGVLNTSLSTNGPPLVFALQARRLDPAQFRATMAAVFAFSNVFAMVLFISSGKVTRAGLLTAAFAAPAMAVGQVVGWPIRRHVHGRRFRWLVLGLLAAAGLSAIAGALR